VWGKIFQGEGLKRGLVDDGTGGRVKTDASPGRGVKKGFSNVVRKEGRLSWEAHHSVPRILISGTSRGGRRGKKKLGSLDCRVCRDLAGEDVAARKGQRFNDRRNSGERR